LLKFKTQIKMIRIVSTKFFLLYRMFIGNKPGAFLFAFRTISLVKALWVLPMKRFPFLKFSKISTYVITG